MTDAQPQPATVDDYIAAFPDDVQAKLQAVRDAIREIAPDAEEAIKYQLPTFVLRGKNLVHFGGFKHHIGFYPTPSGTDRFQAEIAGYKHAKGSIQFPLNEPIPFDLIREITTFRVAEVTAADKKA